MGVEFSVLGPLAASVSGRPLELGGRKQRALLALLLLHANEVVPAERALEEIWSTAAPAAARRSLQVYVSSLRKALGEAADRLQTRPGGYLLAVEPEELDASRFERLVREGGAAAGDPDRAAALFRAALELWRGPALADLRYEEFALAEVDRLEELRLSALEQRLEADLAAGRHEEVCSELEALVAEQPLRERLRGQLMRALYRSGRQADALPPTARPGERSARTSAWSRARSSGSSRRPSCVRIPLSPWSPRSCGCGAGCRRQRPRSSAGGGRWRPSWASCAARPGSRP